MHSDAVNSFIIKLDNNFSTIWMRNGYTHIPIGGGGIQGTGVKCLKEIELDKFDNIYAVANGNGDTTRFGRLSFTHLTKTSYKQDVYLIKYNRFGQEQWIRYGRSPENDYVYALLTDKWGNSILTAMSGNNAIGNMVFGTDSIKSYHGGLIKYDSKGNLIFTKTLQLGKVLTKLAPGLESTFFGTGNGISYASPYDTLQINDCEDSVNAHNVDFKMVMVKFLDNSYNDTTITKLNEFKALDFNIFPNPTNSTINIQIVENNKIYTLKIFDLLGNLVQENKVNNNFEVDISKLADGIYIVKLTDNFNQTVTKKIIKN